MSRFTSLPGAPWETRRLLRSRLRRLLPMRPAMPLASNERPVMLEDGVMLRLLKGITLTHAADASVARALYDHHAGAVPGQPAFDDHVADGWFRLFLGRFHTGLDASRGGRREATRLPALAAYLAQRYTEQVDLPSAAAADADLTDVLKRIASDDRGLRDMGCRTPGWVAARLWEQRPWPGDPQASLRWWLDRWAILDGPPILAARDLEASAAQALRAAMLDALVADVAPHGWEEARNFLAQQGRNATGFGFALPALPPTLIERVRWLDDQVVEPAGYEDGAREEVEAIVDLLLAEVEVELNTPVPHPVLGQLFDLAVRRADVMRALVQRMWRRPALLSDMLLDPLLSAVAVLLIATFDRQAEGYDREFQLRTDAQLKAMAFEDAIDIFLHHLTGDPLLMDQAAGLITVLYRWGALQPATWPESGLPEQLADALARSAQADAIVDHLVAVCAPIDDNGAAFRAALDLIAKAGLVDEVAGDPLVEAYIEAVLAQKETFDLDRLSPVAAGILLTLAARSTFHASDFLRPMPFEKALQRAHRDEDHDEVHRLRRAILSTVRLLARGIGALGDAAPHEAIEALIRTIRAGSSEDPAKGRTAAFAVPGWTAARIYRGNRAVAADLGDALSALAGNDRDRLLQVILEINEPLVLAELLAGVPASCREAICARLDAFLPEDAAELDMVTSYLQRIRALLNAGRSDAAARFMVVEQTLTRRGPTPERAVSQLTHRLHLHLLRDEWSAITAATEPADLPQIDRDRARDVLAHYQGIAALNDGQGRAAIAVERFEALSERHPESASHAINLLAARSQLILGDDYFRLLAPGEQAAARGAMAEAEARFLLIDGVSDAERDALNVNIAILQLALGEPAAAAARLDALAARGVHPERAAYQAIAMARTGRRPAASALIRQVDADLDAPNELLEAARAHIEFGTAYPAPPVLALGLESGPLRAALHTVPRLNPPDQATVLGSPSFTDFIVGHVRKAGASLGNIVPMMKPGEDDVTAPLRELLTARFELVGWSLADQSKGGYTDKGNPGERDLVVLHRETVVTIIEAVIARGHVPRDNLAYHFRKLLGYGQCQVYFHLTYAWLDSTTNLLATLEDIAEKEVPDAFRYMKRRALVAIGNQPGGFIASYEGEGGVIEVVFLVLDLEQASLRRIASQAPATVTTKRRAARTRPTPP